MKEYEKSYIKTLAVLALLLLMCACWSMNPLDITRVTDDVKYPYEISVITNTKAMKDAEFKEHVNTFLKESTYWQKRVIIEVRFEEVERLHTGKMLYTAYVFWRNK